MTPIRSYLNCILVPLAAIMISWSGATSPSALPGTTGVQADSGGGIIPTSAGTSAGTSTSTTGTTGTTTSSTTGTGVAIGSDYNPINLYVQGGLEKKAVFSRRNPAGTAIDDPARHTYAVTLGLGNSGWVVKNPTDPQYDFSSTRPVSGGNPTNQTPAFFGQTNLATGGVTENVPANLDQGAVRPGDTDHTFYLLSPGEMGNGGILGVADTVPPSSGAQAVACLSGHLPDDGTAVVQLGSSGVLNADTLYCLVKTRKWWHTLDALVSQSPQYMFDPMTNTGYWIPGWVRYFWKYHESTSWVKYPYVVSKLICDDTSLDTRKMYGQPMSATTLPAIDPNSPLRSPNFDNYDYQGGLFVGNIPANTKDQSGLSRIQLYPRGGSVSATTRWATLAMVHLGVPATHGTVSSLAVTTYVPSSSDPYAAVTNTQVHWDTKWDRSLAAAGQTLTFTGAPDANDYSNWHWSGSIPTNLTSIGILLANGTEDLNTYNWHYFASKEYAVPGAVLPITDAKPRLWLVTEGTVVRW